MQTSVLLSVKPQFASAILEGTKKFEFRRVLFRSSQVRRIVLYASSPVRKVVGEFVLADIISMRPSALWAATRSRSGIDRKYFYEYFEGVDEGHALKVANPRRYRKPLDLWKQFGIQRPPQSFCYLT